VLRLYAIVLGLLSSVGFSPPQRPPANYDETRVPAYVLPDPLVRTNGTRVTTPQAWRSGRRPELLRLFAREM